MSSAAVPMPSPEVACTAEHAAEVRACQAGQDRLEQVYRSLGHAQAPLRPARSGGSEAVPGHHWESIRPLELDPAPPPRIAFAPQWDRLRGRFCGLAGRFNVRLLRARSAF